MINHSRGWQRIAALLLSCSSTTAWAQLPAQQLSPLTQLGRSWGFGISDGYHECLECKRPPVQSRQKAGTAKVLHTKPCLDCEQKPSLFTRMNPFKESASNGNPSTSGSNGNSPMTVLPPSPEMYLQFAAPDVTPLPGTNPRPNELHSFSNQSPPVTQGPYLPESSPTSSGNQVLDPIEQDSLENQALQNDATQYHPQQYLDMVPPPPSLRKRQQGDKPMEVYGNPKTPGEKVPAQPTGKPAANADDSLDLLPKDEPPPITLRSQPRTNRSLISHATPIPESRPAYPALNSHDELLRQYYGKAYSRQELPNAVPSDTTTAQEFARPTVNRYR